MGTSAGDRGRQCAVVASACVLLALSGCRQPSDPTAADASEPDPSNPLQVSEAAGSPGPPQPGNALSGAEVAYGALIDFGVGGGADALKVFGWYEPENGFTWAKGHAATVACRVTPTDSPIALRFKASGLIKEPELPFQPVAVYVNKQKLADLHIGHTAEFSVPIPQQFTKAGGLLTITFRMPKATSPLVLGFGQDDRTLGIRLLDLTFQPLG